MRLAIHVLCMFAALAFAGCEARRNAEPPAAPAPQAPKGPLKVNMEERGLIFLDLPAEWNRRIFRKGRVFPQVKLQPAEGMEFDAMMNFHWNTDQPTTKPLAVMRAELKDAGNAQLQGSVEEKLQIDEIRHNGVVRGYSFRLTARNAQPGVFRYTTQGEVLIDDICVAFTVLTVSDTPQIPAKLIEVLLKARHEPAEAK